MVVLAMWCNLFHLGRGKVVCHTPILKGVNQSLYTCAHDAQITRMTNSKVKQITMSRLHHYQSISLTK
jgi:hypothetical protein